MRRRSFLAACAVPLAAACAPTRLVLVPPPATEARIRPVVSSLLVRDVELPAYAASDAIALMDEAGVLEVTALLWADAPARSIQGGLVEALTEITGARVAAEPWPFAQRPAAEVSVRVSRLVARPAGALDFAGSYAIAPVDSGLADRSGRFDITVPLAGAGAPALGAAQARAVAELAETVARRLAA